MAWIWVYGSQSAQGEGRPVPLPAEGLGVGREADNGLALEDTGISRHHARITRAGGAWVLEDLGSANGTWIGQERVQRRILQPGEAVRLGATILVLAEDPEPQDPPPIAGPCRTQPAPSRRWRSLLLLPPPSWRWRAWGCWPSC